MKKVQLKIDIAQDGEPISENFIIQYGLNKNDLFYSSKGIAYANFVGVIQRGNKLLVSIPKHFKRIKEFMNLSDDLKRKYIRLIMDSINESVLGYQNALFDNAKDTSSSFALHAYFKIHEYYSRYGLYHEEHQIIQPHKGTKIAWKETMHKANKFVSSGNLIFSPIFFKKKMSDETIITECMIFIINYTHSLLGDFMTLPSNSKIVGRGINMSILNNSAIIYKLQEILSRTFKDINKQLITNILIFLKEANANPMKIPDIKYYNFASTWEQAVHKYLNERFVKVNEENELVFSHTDNNVKNDFIKRPIRYNKVNNWYLEPDHLLKDQVNKCLYIFDSKYYRELKDLNHKQFVYHVLLTNKYPEYTIFDSLIMPSDDITRTTKYVNISEQYLSQDKKPITIYLTHLNMIDVLKNYVYQ